MEQTIVEKKIDQSLRKSLDYRCPFIFTDFEHSEELLSNIFRKISAANLVGSIIGGKDVAERQQERVCDRFGSEVTEEFNKWVNYVKQQTPHTDLADIQRKYPELDLTKYRKKNP